ncbi:hypothetical protein [Oceanicola sp. S124]|uniref:hypothetical protein n=1 Tax=Oceanicola sp. S124 TaxID=1042378 RepID=UPI0002558230|nr:hypothetical protein [Oceanicola sp. S124]
MGFTEALIAAAGLGSVAMSVIALPRRPVGPVLVALIGAGVLAALSYDWGSQPCQSDAAGCGMQRGFEALVVGAAAAPLAIGVLAAIAWRILAGREATLKTRLLVLGGMILLMSVFVVSIM